MAHAHFVENDRNLSTFDPACAKSPAVSWRIALHFAAFSRILSHLVTFRLQSAIFDTCHTFGPKIRAKRGVSLLRVALQFALVGASVLGNRLEGCLGEGRAITERILTANECLR